jgi:hypothetical protein
MIATSAKNSGSLMKVEIPGNILDVVQIIDLQVVSVSGRLFQV